MKKALLLTGPALFLIACVALSEPIAALKGTPTPYPSRTATPTLSPTPSPSITPEPTQTATAYPSSTPDLRLSPTPSVPPPSPSATATVPSELDCQLIWQSPRNGVIYDPDVEFTVGWNVRNNGTAVWEANSVDFIYLGGAKMYDYPVVRLKSSVAPGQDVVLSVHMRTPIRDSTGYTTYWSLRRGQTFFCRLRVSIYVE